MEIAIVDAGSTATVKLTGRLDILGAESVFRPLAALSDSKSGILIDMSGVTFLASVGLRHLVTAAKAVQRRGGRLALVNPTAATTEVIEASGLADLLPIERGAPG